VYVCVTSWGTPKDDGGRDIVDYEISYIEMAKKESASVQGAGKRSGIEPREVRYHS
jgi:hypothetical protein